MPLRFTFDIEGQAQVDRMLGAVASKVKDLRGAWDDIQDSFITNRIMQFDMQGAFQGWTGWAPIDPEYARRKAANGYDSRIMHRTLRLRQSLTKKSHPDHIFSKSRKQMVIGTRVPYAKYHQMGTRYLPKREPIRIGKSERRQWVRLMLRHIVSTGQFAREHF